MPLFFFALGLGFTLVLAMMQEHAADQRTEDQFDGTVATVERRISDEISRRITEFLVTIDFVSSQRAVDHAQLESFLVRRSEERSPIVEGDPGLTVSQFTTDVPALVAAERARGRDFDVFAPLPVTAEERLIITYVENDVEVFGRSFVGFDVTNFQGLLNGPDTVGDSREVSIVVTPIRNLLGILQTHGTATGAEPSDFEEAVVYLIGTWETASGDIGYATRLESLSDVIATVRETIPVGYQLVASLENEPRPIVEVDRRMQPEIGLEAALTVVGTSRNEVVDLAPLEIRLAASPEIRAAGSGFADPFVWFLGLGASTVGALLAWMRSRQARRLADAGLELEIAQTMASTDALTGLLNRQGLVNAIETPEPRAGVLLFIDIDDFKRVNDDDGHDAGDRVLRSIAEALREIVRLDDVVCRLGGDEFLIFLPLPVDDARIRDIVARVTRAVERIDRRISCSIGESRRTTENMLPVETLLRSADLQMYAAKRAKRAARR